MSYLSMPSCGLIYVSPVRAGRYLSQALSQDHCFLLVYLCFTCESRKVFKPSALTGSLLLTCMISVIACCVIVLINLVLTELNSERTGLN